MFGNAKVALKLKLLIFKMPFTYINYYENQPVDFKKTVCLLLIFINFFFIRWRRRGNLPDIDAGAAAVMDMDTGRLLFGKTTICEDRWPAPLK